MSDRLEAIREREINDYDDVAFRKRLFMAIVDVKHLLSLIGEVVEVTAPNKCPCNSLALWGDRKCRLPNINISCMEPSEIPTFCPLRTKPITIKLGE